MSAFLQSGHHPDADQLNAFVEHALPAHEREETLAHLSLCPDCRTVVAFSVPPAPETLPAPVPARRPWSSGWKVFWPIATAATLAALVIATIHMRNISVDRLAPAIPQVAQIQAPTRNTQPPTAVESHKRKFPAATKQTGPAPVGASAAKTEPADIFQLPLLGRNVVPLQVSPPSGSAIGPPTAGIASGNGAGIAAAAMPQALSLPVPVTSAAHYMAAPMGADAASRSAERVTVAGSGAAILGIHPLPSGLPALSIVSNARQDQTLAVDIHGALFLTADSGEHWVPIAAQWPGRAVKVDLAYSRGVHAASITGDLSIKKNSLLAEQRSTFGAPGTVSSGTALSGLRGTITDTTGAIIPGATVIVMAAPTQLARMAKTGASGNYVVDGLVPGKYSVEASLPGFEMQHLSGIVVTPESNATANLTLSVVAASETVNVEAASQVELDEPEAKRRAATPARTAPSPPVFEITTESGEQWVSADGLIWRHK